MSEKIRARGQVLPMVVIGLVMLFTLGSAGANLIPHHYPTPAEIRGEELHVLRNTRRERIVELRETKCEPVQAHELVRLLALDGQWDTLHAFGDRYEETCGADLIVHGWATAHRKPR